jgi:predicted transcriptional regulator
MQSNLHEGIWKMLSKIVRRRPVSAAALTSTTRSAISAMVEKEARRVGSRTLAYKNIGRMIGMSDSWVRKYLDNRGGVGEPRTPLFQQIRIAYSNLCERVEQLNRKDEERLRSIRNDLNAVTEGFDAESDTESPNMVGEGE